MEDGSTDNDLQSTGPSIVHEAEPEGKRGRISHGRHELSLLPDEPGMVGYLARKYVVTDRGTYFTNGAFKRTIEHHPARPHLWQHWADMIIGVNQAIEEDSKGFKIKAVLNEDDADGARAMSVYRFGLMHGWVPDWSLGFDRLKDRSGTEADFKRLDFSGAPEYRNSAPEDLRAITEASWWEGSTVTWGALAGAGPDVIHRAGPEIVARVVDMCAAIRSGRLPDDQLQQLQDELTATQTQRGRGSGHSTSPAPVSRPYAAELDLLFLELGISQGEHAA
jgi:HK97 family phage prohead protease